MLKKRRKGRQSIKMLNPVRRRKSAGIYTPEEDRELTEAEFQLQTRRVGVEKALELRRPNRSGRDQRTLLVDLDSQRPPGAQGANPSFILRGAHSTLLRTAESRPDTPISLWDQGRPAIGKNSSLHNPGIGSQANRS